MNRRDVLNYIEDKHGVTPEYPWARNPNYAIFRHDHNRKWFGTIMDINENKLGLDGDDLIDVLNVKCDPELIGSLRCESHILPGYHMNKEHWITILIERPVSDDEICSLIDISYDLTK